MADAQYGDPNRTGSGFVNLQQYLDANKDNDLEKTVAGGITGESKKAQDDLSAADQKFSQDANAARSDVDASGNNTLDSVKNTLKKAEDDPSKLSDDDYKQFQGTTGKTYTPPVASRVGQNELNEAQTAESAGQAVNSEGGRYGLLQRYLGGNGGYTMGQQGLDSALLANSNGNALRQAQRSTVGLTGRVNSVAQTEQNANQQYSNADKMFHQAANASLYGDGGTATDVRGGSIGNVQNAAQTRANTYNDNAVKYGDDIRKALTQGDLSGLNADEKNALGGLRNFSGQLYGLDPSQYLVSGQLATGKTAITPQEQAKLAALYKLTGGTNTFAPDATTAGTTVSPVSFNYDAFNKDLQSHSSPNINQSFALMKQMAELRQAQANENNPGNTDSRYLENRRQQNEQLEALAAQLKQLQNTAGQTRDFRSQLGR